MLKFPNQYRHLLILIDRSDNLDTAYHWDWKYCHLHITGVGHHHDPRDSKLRLLRASHWAAVLHEEYSSFWYEEQCCSFRFMNIASNDCLIFHYIHQPTMFSGVPYLVMWFVALGGSFTVDKLIGENKNINVKLNLCLISSVLSFFLIFSRLKNFIQGNETLSTVTARKIANSIATMGPALALLGCHLIFLFSSTSPLSSISSIENIPINWQK